MTRNLRPSAPGSAEVSPEGDPDDRAWAVGLAAQLGIASDRRGAFAKGLHGSIADWRAERRAPSEEEIAAELIAFGKRIWLALERPSASAFARAARAMAGLSPAALDELQRHERWIGPLPELEAVARGDEAALRRLFALNPASPVTVEEVAPRGPRKVSRRAPALGHESWRWQGGLPPKRKRGRPKDRAGQRLGEAIHVLLRWHLPPGTPPEAVLGAYYKAVHAVRLRLGEVAWPNRQSHASNDRWAQAGIALYDPAAPHNDPSKKPCGHSDLES